MFIVFGNCLTAIRPSDANLVTYSVFVSDKLASTLPADGAAGRKEDACIREIRAFKKKKAMCIDEAPPAGIERWQSGPWAQGAEACSEATCRPAPTAESARRRDRENRHFCLTVGQLAA